MHDSHHRAAADLREGYQALRLAIDLLLQDGSDQPLEVLQVIERSVDRTLGAVDHIIATFDDHPGA